MQDTLQKEWQSLVQRMLDIDPDISRGKMMSADALVYRGKVFVFFSTKGGLIGLGGRLGRETDIDRFQLQDWQHLAPFKTKPPMKDWIVVGEQDLHRWQEIADFCLHKAKTRGNTG